MQPVSRCVVGKNGGLTSATTRLVSTQQRFQGGSSSPRDGFTGDGQARPRGQVRGSTGNFENGRVPRGARIYSPRHKDAPRMSRPRRDMVTRVSFNTTTDGVDAEGDADDGGWRGRGGVVAGRPGSTVQQEARRAVDTAHGYSHSVHYRPGDHAPGAKPTDGDSGEEHVAVGDGNDSLPLKAGSYRDGMGMLISDEHPDGEYRPARRPSRIVQPVDIHRMADTAMHRQSEARRVIKEHHAAVSPNGKRALAAGEVPVEMTVGNVFTVVLDACRSQGLLMASSFGDSTPPPPSSSSSSKWANGAVSGTFSSSSISPTNISGNGGGDKVNYPLGSDVLGLKLKGSNKGPLIPPILGARDVVAPPLNLLVELTKFVNSAALHITTSSNKNAATTTSDDVVAPKAAVAPQTTNKKEGKTTAVDALKQLFSNEITQNLQNDESVMTNTTSTTTTQWSELALRALDTNSLDSVDNAMIYYIRSTNGDDVIDSSSSASSSCAFNSPAEAFHRLVVIPAVEKEAIKKGTKSTLSPLPASRLMQTTLEESMQVDGDGFVFSTLEIQYKYWEFLLGGKNRAVLLESHRSADTTYTKYEAQSGNNSGSSNEEKVGNNNTKPEGTTSAITKLHASFAHTALAPAVERAYKCWDLVSATPLASPNHGTLALQGKAFAENSLVNDLLLPTFPRLRSRMLQNIVAKLIASPLVTIRVANRLGITDQANYGVEVGLYGDFIMLMSQLRHFQELLRIHKKRSERKIFPNHFERYSKRVMLIERALRRIPVDPDTLHLRYKWLHDLVYSFIGFTLRTEGAVVTKTLVLNLFAPALGRYLHRRNVIRGAIDAFGDAVHTSKLITSSSATNTNSSIPPVLAFIQRASNTALKEALLSTTLSSLVGGAGSGDVERLHDDLIRAKEIATSVNSLANISLLQIDNQYEATTPSSSSSVESLSMTEVRSILQICKNITATWMTQQIPTGEDMLGNQSIVSPASLHPLTQNADENVIRRTTAAGPHTSAGASDMESGGAGNLLNMAEEDQNEVISTRGISDHEAISALIVGGGEGIVAVLKRSARLHDDPSSDTAPLKSEEGTDLSLIDQLNLLRHSSSSAEGDAEAVEESNDLTLRLLESSMQNLSDVLPRPPVSITATTNSATPDAFREVLLLLKYLRSQNSTPGVGDSSTTSAPSKDEGMLANLVRETGAVSYEQYLDGEVYKRTDVVRRSTTSPVDSGPPNMFENVEFFVGNLYLYVSQEVNNNSNPRRHNSGDDDGSYADEDKPSKKQTKMQRFLLSVGRGINPEEALQAAARNLLQRHYYSSS